MKLIRDPSSPLETDTVGTIGIFDGVHVGHRKLLDLVKAEACAKGLASLVVTFDPHPQSVLTGVNLPLIVPFRERVRLLGEAGVDLVVCYTFTPRFARLSAERFVRDVLASTLRMKSIYIGPDFLFGSGRGGNVDLLKKLGCEVGFSTHVVGPFYLDGTVISSTSIRSMIEEGDVKGAARFLGAFFSLSGKVVEGEKRGRLLGYPTANVATDWTLLPRRGVYATRAHVCGACWGSITNVGTRPTFGDGKLLVETHLFDFEGDIYGADIRVEFVDRIRDERRFESVEELKAAIGRDVEKARRLLATPA